MPGMAEEAQTPEERSRRDLLSKGALVAAVAAVSGVAIAKPTSATDGDPMFVGTSHTASATTQITGGGSLRVQSGSSDSLASIVGYQTNDGMIGVLGRLESCAGGIGVKGVTDSGGTAVYGQSLGSSPCAVGTGVHGFSYGGVGVIGEGAQADFKAQLSGRVWIATAGVSNPPTIGFQGNIARDSTGALWYCYADNLWRKLAGPTAAGAFHAIDPVRVYDSRAAAPNPGLLAPNLSRVVSVKDGRNSVGDVTAADVVPAGASAVTFNVTATGTTGANFLSVAPGNATGFTTSTLNWPGGTDIANASTVKIDASRQVKVFMGDNVGSSHFIIDVTGFFL